MITFALTQPTTLSYTGPTSGPYGSAVTLTASLSSRGIPLSGQPVSIGFGAESCTGTTLASGAASCQVTPLDSPAGDPYQVKASFAGALGYGASGDTSRSFTVTPATTSLIASPQVVLLPPPTAVGLGELSATLTSGGHPLGGQTISFSTGGTPLCTAKTGATGVATCRASVLGELHVLLHNSYTARFTPAAGGDYAGSSASTAAVELGSGLTARSATDGASMRAAVIAGGRLERGRVVYARMFRQGARRLRVLVGRRPEPGRYDLTLSVDGTRIEQTITLR